MGKWILPELTKTNKKSAHLWAGTNYGEFLSKRNIFEKSQAIRKVRL